MDITNKIFECEETIDYRLVNNIIKANVLLKGDGMFWIFLHLNHMTLKKKKFQIILATLNLI